MRQILHVKNNCCMEKIIRECGNKSPCVQTVCYMYETNITTREETSACRIFCTCKKSCMEKEILFVREIRTCKINITCKKLHAELFSACTDSCMQKKYM